MQRVLMKVGNEIRHREEQSGQLRWRISDLEHQLTDVRQNIEEYCESSALEGAALSWTSSLLHLLEIDWNKLKENYLYPAITAFDESYRITTSDGKLLQLVAHLVSTDYNFGFRTIVDQFRE